MDEWVLPFRMRELDEKMKDRARMELGETSDVKKKCLAEIRAFVKENDNLQCSDDEIFFLAFLRKGKYDMKRVIKLMQMYFSEKKNFPEIFSTPNMDGLKKCLSTQMASILPHRDRDGSAIIVFRAEYWDVDEIKFSTIIHFMAVSLLSSVEYEPSQVCGVKILMSTKGISLKHIRHIQLRYLTLLARGVRSCIPVRLKGVHIANENVHVRFLWNFVSFYVGAKIRSRLHFHGSDHKGIQDFIDPAVIPTDFGGDFEDRPSYGLSELDYLQDTNIKRLSAGYR